jgi:hypothetical protein
VNELHTPLLNVVIDIINQFYVSIDAVAAQHIQRVFRGWRMRRRYAPERRRVFQELHCLPPKHIHVDFPGGELYHACLRRFHMIQYEA